MGTNQLLEHVKNIVKGNESETWLPQTLNRFCEKTELLSNNEIEDLELVYFELHFWLKNNTGHFYLRDAMANLEKKLQQDARARRIKACVSIGACYDYSKDHLWGKK